MYCVLVAGMPATGKTRFAAWLGEKRGIPWMSKDGIKEMLFDRIGFSSRGEKVQLGLAAQDMLYAFAEAQLAAGCSFILENNFEDSSRRPLEELLDKYDCRVITVRFGGEIGAIHRRFLERDQSPERHRGHVVNTRYPEVGEKAAYVPLSLENFAAGMMARGFDRFCLGRLVCVDATDFANVDYEAIERAIGE